MTHSKKTSKRIHSVLAASALTTLLAAPLAFGTPMEVSEAPARGNASASGTLSSSMSGQSSATSAYGTQLQMTPDQGSLFGSGSSLDGRSEVPEPGTLLLVGLGLLGAAAARRR